MDAVAAARVPRRSKTKRRADQARPPSRERRARRGRAASARRARRGWPPPPPRTPPPRRSRARDPARPRTRGPPPRAGGRAADAATRAAADATASARARANLGARRVAAPADARAPVWDPHPHPHSQEASEGLPHTPPVMARGGVSNAADGDGTETPRGALPPSPTSAIRASELGVFRSGDFHSEPTRDPPALVRAPGSLGKPRRVPISEHDALLFDAAEAKLRLREGRRRAAAAFKDGALKDGVDGEGGADALELKLDANDAARADSKRVASSAGLARSSRRARRPRGAPSGAPLRPRGPRRAPRWTPWTARRRGRARGWCVSRNLRFGSGRDGPRGRRCGDRGGSRLVARDRRESRVGGERAR